MSPTTQTWWMESDGAWAGSVHAADPMLKIDFDQFERTKAIRTLLGG